MRWKINELNKRQRELVNKALGKVSANTSVSSDNLEQNISNEQVGAREAPQMVTPCRLHLHSRRYRLADSDGISGKAVIDGIVHAGVLPDDSPKEVTITSQSQEKISREEKEITIITLTGVE